MYKSFTFFFLILPQETNQWFELNCIQLTIEFSNFLFSSKQEQNLHLIVCIFVYFCVFLSVMSKRYDLQNRINPMGLVQQYIYFIQKLICSDIIKFKYKFKQNISFMKKYESIQIEPEIIQINVNDTEQKPYQILKIKNITGNTMNGIFFCLYNPKFEIDPENFNLLPYEGKLITIKINLDPEERLKKGSYKQFAYIKSSQINKRLTIILNFNENLLFQQKKQYQNFQSSGIINLRKSKQQELSYENDNSFSYQAQLKNETNKFQSIIQQKQQKITTLQKQIKLKNTKMEQLIGMVQLQKNKKISELQQKEQRMNSILKLKQQQQQKIRKENQALKSNIQKVKKKQEQYRNLYEKQIVIFKKLQQEIQSNFINRSLVQDYIKQIDQKNTKIKQLENTIQQLRNQIKLQTKNIQSLKSEKQKQKQIYQWKIVEYQKKIKKLESELENSIILRQHSQKLQSQLQIKIKQLNKIKTLIEPMQNIKKQLESEKIKNHKIQIELGKNNQNYKKLNQKLRNCENLIESQKQQLILTKRGLSNQEEKDIELQNIKQQYEIIIKQYNTLQKLNNDNQNSINKFVQNDKKQKEKIQLISRQLTRYEQYIKQNKQKKDNQQQLISQNEKLKKELRKLEQQKILMSEGILKQHINSKQQIQCQNMKNQISQLQIQLRKRKQQAQDLKKRNQEIERQKIQIQYQTNRYKQEIKKQLDNINNISINQLKKLFNQKKKLIKRLNKYQNNQNVINRSKSRSKIQSFKLSKTNTEKILKKNPRMSQLDQIPNSKLHSIQQQINSIRQQLNAFKKQNKKLDMQNRSKQKQNSNDKKKTLIDQQKYKQLGELRQFHKIVESQMKKIESLLKIHYKLDNEEISIFKVINFFKCVNQKLKNCEEQRNCEWKQLEIEYIEEIKKLKLQLINLKSMYENRQKNENNNNNQELECQKKIKLIQFIQQQMKIQHKKLTQALEFSNQKYQIFKLKVINQYRNRIMQILLKKDKKQLQKLQNLIEKFIQSLSNVSHKQAIISKQTKKKNDFKRENKSLKQKINSLDALLEVKKLPNKVQLTRSQQQIYQNIKHQTQLLSTIAENQRLKQQLDIAQQNLSTKQNQFQNCIENLDNKQQEIKSLKQQVISIREMHKKQLSKANEDIQKIKNEFFIFSSNKNKNQINSNIQRQLVQLREQLIKKKQIIKSLKQKQKTLMQTIQKIKNQKIQDKQKLRSREQNRTQQFINDLKEKNRELRKQLDIKYQNQKRLQDELEKKNIYISSMKAATNSSKQKQKTQSITFSVQNQNLKNQNKKLIERVQDLKNTNMKLHQNNDSLKQNIQQLQKFLNSTQNQLKSIQHEYLIKEKSFMSVIRGFIQILRRLWRYIEIKIRKMYPSQTLVNFDELVKDPLKLQMIKLYEAFEEILKKIFDT